MSNRAIEEAAIAFVLSWEAAHRRPSRDTRGTGAAGDVAGLLRTIEVKAYGGFDAVRICGSNPARSTKAATIPTSGCKEVENIRQGDPAQFRLLGRAVERRYFTIPWPVAIYDQLVREQHPT